MVMLTLVKVECEVKSGSFVPVTLAARVNGEFVTVGEDGVGWGRSCSSQPRMLQ